MLSSKKKKFVFSMTFAAIFLSFIIFISFAIVEKVIISG